MKSRGGSSIEPLDCLHVLTPEVLGDPDGSIRLRGRQVGDKLAQMIVVTVTKLTFHDHDPPLRTAGNKVYAEIAHCVLAPCR
jgi:hypothetical protein